jgi:hypothetical protein
MIKTFIFRQSNKLHPENWTLLRSSLNYALNKIVVDSKMNGFSKDFQVTIEEVKTVKTNPQLRGIHKLCQMLVDSFAAEWNKKFTLEEIKNNLKVKLGYMREPTDFEVNFMLLSKGIKLEDFDSQEYQRAQNFVKGIKQPKSFADATKQEMIDLITGIEAWAAQQGLKGIFLTSEEKQEMVRHYERKS